MTNAPLLGLLAIAAIWPFGHHHHERHKPATGTIKDVEGLNVEVDTSTPIGGGEAKAMESYKLFLDLASDDELLLGASHPRIDHRRVLVAARRVIGAELHVEQREERA